MKILRDLLDHEMLGEFSDMKIKIVGSAGDQDDANTIRHTTEIFLLERRIRQIVSSQDMNKNGEPSSSQQNLP